MSGKFALQWVNDASGTYTRPMNTAVFTLRDPVSTQMGDGGLSCAHLHLDQVHVQFRPTTSIGTGEFRTGDGAQKDWRAETQHLYVRTTPGVRHTLYTDGRPTEPPRNSTGRTPSRSLVYSSALTVTPYTGLAAEDVWCRTYRPVRDLPVLSSVDSLSEIQVDLLWPLLQGDPTATWWSVPDYRILRVICEFSYTQ